MIYAGSMSKLLVPALRIGYIAAAPKVVDALAYQISLIDGMGNTVTEEAAAELLESGEVRRHVRKTAQIYARRRDAFARNLDSEMDRLIDYRLPDGGLAFWLQFKDMAALDRLEARAPEIGLSFASSHSYAAEEGTERGLRIGFAPQVRFDHDTTAAQGKGGVVLRPMGGYGLGHCLRITVGTRDENRRFLQALDEVRA